MPTASHPRATVLIVEDDPGIAELEKTRLEEAGYRTVLAPAAEDAIQALRRQPIDLVLLDYRLPGGVDGLEFYARVKAAGFDVPVILVTGYSSEATVIQALRVGVRDFVTKSVEYLDYLPEAVARVLRQVDTEHQLASIIASARDAIISTDPDRRVILFNPAAERMFGYPAAAARGRRVTDLIPDELAAAAAGPDAATLSHRLRTGTRGVRADGTEFPVEVSVARGEAGGRRFYTLVVRDVTDRKRVEEDREKFVALVENSADFIGMATLDGRVFYVNPAGRRLVGIEDGEPVAGRIEDYVPEDVAAMYRAVAIPQALGGGRWEGETRFRHRRTGTEIDVQQSVFVVRTPGGSGPLCLATVARDVTDRKRAAEALLRARQRLEYVVTASPAVLFTLALSDGRIRGITWISENLRRMLGYDPAEAADPHWWVENIHPDDRDRVVAETHESLFARGTADHEYRFRHRDGVYRWTRGEIRLLRDGDDRPAEAVGSWTDVSERKLLEEQLRQAQKMEAVGQLAGGVAHDFNNLLTVINGYSQLLLDTLAAGDPNRGLVEEVYQAGERAARLTRQLLVFSRKDVVEPRVLDLNAVVEETGRLLRRLIGEDVRLTVTLARDLAPVRADPGQVEQVLMNLVVNARDAMPTGGRLTIETANVSLGADYGRTHAGVTPGRYVLLAVSDTGSGMSDEVKARVFEPFFTTKGPGRGTGLGLATVYGIVQQSGGHVEVYSEVGVGTTLKVYLPPAADRPRPPDSVNWEALAPRGTETVLVVEDEDAVRGLARIALQTTGYVVLEAGTGEDAVRVCGSHPGPIHLLITDVVMPGMGGRQVAEAVCARRPEVKVLYLSGYTDDAVVRHGILHADVAFLQKPFTPAALARKVRDVLGGQ